MEWRTSTYSTGGGGQCVETASRDGLVMIRDSANRGTMTLAVPAAAWTTFTASLRSHVCPTPLTGAIERLSR